MISPSAVIGLALGVILSLILLDLGVRERDAYRSRMFGVCGLALYGLTLFSFILVW